MGRLGAFSVSLDVDLLSSYDLFQKQLLFTFIYSQPLIVFINPKLPNEMTHSLQRHAILETIEMLVENSDVNKGMRGFQSDINVATKRGNKTYQQHGRRFDMPARIEN